MHRATRLVRFTTLVVLVLVLAVGRAEAQRKGEVVVDAADPKALTIFPDDKAVVAITGRALDQADDAVALRARDAKPIGKNLAVALKCRRGGASCDVALTTTGRIAAGQYRVALLRKGTILTTVPFQLTVAPPIELARVSPKKLTLRPGERARVSITGDHFELAANARVQRAKDGRPVGRSIAARLSCNKRGELCRIVVTATGAAKPGRYKLVLRGAGRDLAEVLDLTVVEPAGAPDRVVAIEAEPGVSVQRSCVAGADDTTVELLAPEAGAGLTSGTELVWTRTEHEICGAVGANKRYLFTICGNPSPQTSCLPNDGLFLQITIDPNFIGLGRCAVESEDEDEDIDCQITEADLDEIAQEGGVEQGDTVYWQVAYSYDAVGGATQRFFTAKRPLLFRVEDVAPEPAPDPDADPDGPLAPVLFNPADGSQIHETNRNFFWSDDSPTGSADWTWEVCLMKPPSEACAGDGPFEVTDNALVGLSYFEFDEFGLIGGEMRWKVRACDETDACGPYSAPFTAYVPLAPAERVYPVHRAEVDSPRTFAWRPVAGAESYRLRIGRTYDDDQGFEVRQLVRVLEDQISDFITAQELASLDRPGGGVNEHLDGVSSWSVVSCYDPDDGGPVDQVCSDTLFAPFESFGGSFVTFTNTPVDPGEVTFDAIVDVFKASSCVNCHAVVPAGLPAGHPPLGGAPNRATDPEGFAQFVGNSANCLGCHNDGLLPITPGQQGTLPISWQATGAPKSVDLRGLSDDELCEVAKSHPPGAAAADPADHLTNDPLVLWSVVGGQLPLNAGNGERAFPGTLDEWRELVANFDEDTPCEKPF